MSKSSANAEPSMEEILASIRQIISDEDPKDGEDTEAAADESEGVGEGIAGGDEAISEADLDALFADGADAEPQPEDDATDAMDDDAVDAEMDVAFDTIEAVEPEIEEPEPEPVDEPIEAEDDVLDLGSLPDAEFDAPEDLDFADPEPQPEPEPVEEPEPQLEPEPDLAMETEEPAGEKPHLLSNESDKMVSAAFADLASTILSGNARTLEDLVQDMLRPMLKSWLDENLPTMVEKMVREEIERVARRGQRR